MMAMSPSLEFERVLELEPDFEPARLNLADAQRSLTA